jgi:hypothetical protein
LQKREKREKIDLPTIKQIAIQQGSGVVKDIVQIPQPFYVVSAAYDNDGMVRVFVCLFVWGLFSFLIPLPNSSKNYLFI